MNEIVVYIALVLIGACFGSFAGATVWRLRARQLADEKKHKQKVDAGEYKRLKKLLGKGALADRSQCLNCGYTLKWYDLVPVLSWLFLRGKCRSCKTFYGWFELIMELAVVIFFVASYVFWPFGLSSTPEVLRFVTWLASGVVMAVLVAYDYKWMLLPNRWSWALAFFGALMGIITAFSSGDVAGVLLNALVSVGVLAGIYGLLYLISKGRWVGLGDVKLGVGLGLLLGDWTLALLALFLANLIGCLIVIPLMAAKKLTAQSHVPFGPMLIAGAIIALLFGAAIIRWYMSLSGLYA